MSQIPAAPPSESSTPNRFLAHLCRGFPYYLTLLYALLTVPRILHHPMWRDEWQAWLLARFSPTYKDLLHNVQYECYPLLWHTILYFVSHHGLGFIWMQLIQVTLAIAVIFVFARYSPFTIRQKIFFTFGYFPFFEYAIISRCYVIGVLALFLAVHFLFSPKPRFILFGICIALMANSSLYGLMMATALGLAAIHYTILNFKNPSFTQARRRLVIGFLIALAGGLLSAFQIWTFRGKNLHLTKGVSTLAHFALGFRGIFGAYFPVPQFFLHFWNTTILDGLDRTFVIVGPILFVFIALLFLRQWVAMTLLVSCSVGLFFIEGFHYLGGERHFGYLYLCLIAAYWIAALNPNPRQTPALLRLRQGVFTCILSLHLVMGLMVSLTEIRVPFSGGREIAQFIQRTYPPGIPIVADPDFAALPIAGYLDRPLYYIGRQEMGTFEYDDEKRRPAKLPLDEWSQPLGDFLTQHQGHDVLLLINYSANITSPLASLVASTDLNNLIQVDEAYLLVLIHNPPQPAN